MTMNFMNDVANDAESTPNSKNYVIIDSLTSEALGKLIYIYIEYQVRVF